jgi:hypothetical protein
MDKSWFLLLDCVAAVLLVPEEGAHRLLGGISVLLFASLLFWGVGWLVF